MRDKFDLDTKSIGRVHKGDVVTIRKVETYCGRDYSNCRYATIYRTAKLSFDTGNGAMDHYRGERRVKQVINDNQAVIV